MAYDWTAEAEKGIAPRLPFGVHEVEITRLIYEGKNGAYKAMDGSPRFMVIFTDAYGREFGQMITCSEKAGWVLARLCSRAGMDVERMKVSNITPMHFAKPEFAQRQLIGRKLLINLIPDGNGYADCIPLKPGSAQPYDGPPIPSKKQRSNAGRTAHADGYGDHHSIDEDDIPF